MEPATYLLPLPCICPAPGSSTAMGVDMELASYIMITPVLGGQTRD